MRVYVWGCSTPEILENDGWCYWDGTAFETKKAATKYAAAPRVYEVCNYFNRAKERGLEEIKAYYEMIAKESEDFRIGTFVYDESKAEHKEAGNGQKFWYLPVNQNVDNQVLFCGYVVIRQMEVK